MIGIFSSEGICQDLCQTARGFASRLLFSHTTVKSSEDDPDDPERIPFPLQDCPSSSVCHANELQMRPQDPHQGTPTPPLLLATRIFRISRIAGRIPSFNFFKVQTRLSRLQSGSKKKIITPCPRYFNRSCQDRSCQIQLHRMVLELDSRGQISVFISHQMILKWILQDLFPQDPPRPSSALTFSRSWRISSETIDPPVTDVILLISRIWWPRESCRIVPRIPVSNDGKTLSDLMSFKLMDLSIRIAC